MRQSLLLTIVLICTIIPLVRGESKTETLTLTFSQSDFSIITDADGTTRIEDLTGKGYYLATQAPGMPMFSVNYAIADGYQYKSIEVSQTQTLLKSPVVLATNPPVAPISNPATPTYSTPIIGNQALSEAMYPHTACKYIETSNFNGIPVLHFQVCPFYYITADNGLHFINKMTIKITLETTESGASPTVFPNRGNIPDYLKTMVKNEYFVDSILRTAATERYLDQIDYVLITTNALKTVFEPLIKWKRTKGVFAKIMSIEDIDRNFPGTDLQLKIKRCLYSLYRNNSLQYALLAGDDSIVPTRGCKGYVNTSKKINDSTYIAVTYEDNTMPADLYYACFDGTFDWDGNGNGIYGEVDDGISRAPAIYVTRAPVRTTSDAAAFISKIIQYEIAPSWANKMLLSGTKLWAYMDSTQTVSDAEAKGRNFYSTYIKPNWYGSKYWFYDTASSFTGGASYDFTANNLTEQLSKGYAFVDVMTHGNQTSWSSEFGSSYSSFNGIRQTSPVHTVVTTMACLTNAFDSSPQGGTYDPCLSESLIRNASSGVIAYLGSSRYGWGYSGGTSQLGPSLQYESYFYEYLFKNKDENKNFGKIAAAAKIAKIPDVSQPSRWLQYAINPIGDPETPIFTVTPKKFDHAIINHKGDSTLVTALIPECRICVMSSNDNGASYYRVYDNVTRVFLKSLPENCSICITKQNYIPKLFTLTNGYIQNVTLTGANNFSYDVIRIGSAVNPNKPTGPVKFEGGTTNIDASTIIIDCDTEIGTNATVIMNSNH